MSGGNSADGKERPAANQKRFKLAEFRYGREEMLALFTGNQKMPPELKEFGDVILRETACEPLSFVPLSEEEEVICDFNLLPLTFCKQFIYDPCNLKQVLNISE